MQVTFVEKYGFIVAYDGEGNEIHFDPNMQIPLTIRYNGKIYEKDGCQLKGCGKGVRTTAKMEDWFWKFSKFAYDEWHEINKIK